MADVYDFPSGLPREYKFHAIVTQTALLPMMQEVPESKNKVEIYSEFPSHPHEFVRAMKVMLEEDDYLDFLEGIVSIEHYNQCDPDIQRIVEGYFERTR